MYHLWNALSSLGLDRLCWPVNQLPGDTVSEGRWLCCLLLDKNYELLGYTLLGG